MTAMPSGTEQVRPFLPTKDFELSKRFYEALGFEKVLDGEVAIFDAGSGGFVLQRHFVQAWAEQTMLQLMVDDLDAWWRHLDSLDCPDASVCNRRSLLRCSHGGCESRTSSTPLACCGTLPSDVTARCRTRVGGWPAPSTTGRQGCVDAGAGSCVLRAARSGLRRKTQAVGGHTRWW